MRSLLAAAASLCLSILAVSVPARADIPPPDTTSSDTSADTATPTDTAVTTEKKSDDCATGSGSAVGLGVIGVMILARRSRRTT